MEQRIRLLLLSVIAAGAAGCDNGAAPAGAAGPPVRAKGPVQLTLSLKVNRHAWTKTKWSKPPQLAVWLEDESGQVVRTVFVTYRTGAGDWLGKDTCPISLPCWVSRYNAETNTCGPPTFQKPAADAVTGATPKESLTARTLVPAGTTWRYFVEVNVSGDFNDAFPPLLPDGQEDKAGNGQPSVVYAGRITAAIGSKDTPTVIGRTDQILPVPGPVADLDGITTAKDLVWDIVMLCRDAPRGALAIRRSPQQNTRGKPRR